METAGRELSAEAEREAMKDAGIGTPATRAAIIETLFADVYKRQPGCREAARYSPGIVRHGRAHHRRDRRGA